MKITRREIEAVVLLPGRERYGYFIKKVADSNQVWGLWNEGWCMGITDTDQRTIAVWPAAEYAELCRVGDWQKCVPRAIGLQEFMREFLPNLVRDGIRVSIFDTPSEASVLINNDELIHDLEEELSKIE
jgi:hypothetical protein